MFLMPKLKVGFKNETPGSTEFKSDQKKDEKRGGILNLILK
jgi:hypothetical protein